MLTGTPLQNDLAELQNLLHFLLPSVFAQEGLEDLAALVQVGVCAGRGGTPISKRSQEGLEDWCRCRTVCIFVRKDPCCEALLLGLSEGLCCWAQAGHKRGWFLVCPA
jgi:hypothetical protein